MHVLTKVKFEALPSPLRGISDSRGFALITSLMFTLISLTIVLSMMYMLTQGTKNSGANKRYKTAIDASYGGAELFTKDVLPYLMQNYSDPNFTTLVNTAFNTVNMQLVNATCLQAKLTSPSGAWPGSCSNSSSPTDNPDMSFNLLSASGNPYKIYSKIVETVGGNSDLSGLQLEGGGVSESSSGITPVHSPYYYRIEVQGAQSINSERANIEVLYAY